VDKHRRAGFPGVDPAGVGPGEAPVAIGVALDDLGDLGLEGAGADMAPGFS